MPDSKSWIAREYQEQSISTVKSCCLKVFQALGAFREQIIVIGGLVPALIIDQSQVEDKEDPVQAHVGTFDVDVGFSLGIVLEEAYDDVVKRLERSGFERDNNNEGNPTNHRWMTGKGSAGVTVDFQIPEDDETPPPGKLQRLTGKLSAIVTPGLELAFDNSNIIELEGRTPEGDRVVRKINICSPSGLLLLKGLAIGEREKWKDYYDIFYVLRNWAGGDEEVAEGMVELFQLDEQNNVKTCVKNLKRDFKSMDHVGPRNVARFFVGQELPNDPDPDLELLMRQAQITVENFTKRIEELMD
jgi:hypothetical protein